MKVEELEAKIKVLENQVQNLGDLQAKIQKLEDIEEIQKLQRIYGFYVERWMAEDIIDLFADGEDSELWLAAGKFKGKEAITHFFRHGTGKPFPYTPDPEFLFQLMQLSGVVDVNPDGKTAKGRWYGFGANAFPVKGGKVNPGWVNGVYEVNYVKEDGKWKLKKVHWSMIFRAPWTEGFVDPAKKDNSKHDRPYQEKENPALRPTGAPQETLYPSGYICPFHYANPISGRKTIPDSSI
jgi:hypothetical protein